MQSKVWLIQSRDVAPGRNLFRQLKRASRKGAKTQRKRKIKSDRTRRGAEDDSILADVSKGGMKFYFLAFHSVSSFCHFASLRLCVIICRSYRVALVTT